ncbi:MAG: class I SAM-dependent methyltransferase [Sphingomonas aquatilis]|uniref:class I SAM-dependent methyltransferase n=1 Tax=Sphingomonas aquatilis TaxID=93063 RepID=UPI002F2E0D0E
MSDRSKSSALQRGGRARLGRFIDHTETYGAHVIESMLRQVRAVQVAVDLGAGTGRDLRLIKHLHPQAHTVAVEAAGDSAEALRGIADDVFLLDIERDTLPFADNSVDVIIANQIMEHTKEVFWIFHQVARTLRPGGKFIMGVPNVLSMHNRFGSLAGVHPTQHKLSCAHVRPFSRRDTEIFLQDCSPGTFKLSGFGGSQFYPFPKAISRILAGAFPNAAFSIFFSFEKVGAYHDGFAKYPERAQLETNFFVGRDQASRFSRAA